MDILNAGSSKQIDASTDTLEAAPEKIEPPKFVVGINALPLANLIDAASWGSRVYELLSISRPADLFHNLYLPYIDLSDGARRHVQNFHRKSRDVTPTGGDLLVQPDWHKFDAVYANKVGRLGAGFYGKSCNYLLTQKDYGELSCAIRAQMGNWFFYQQVEQQKIE